MIQLRILKHLMSSVKPRDSYSESEAKIRSVMGQMKDEGTITGFDVRSDPSGPEYVIWWASKDSPGIQKFRVDPKRIDPDLLTCMEVLDS